MLSNSSSPQPVVCLVEKEQIPQCKFPSKEVINDEAARKERLQTLFTGLTLGNGHRRKVKIIFEDSEGLKQVETTIWAVTEKNVILKQGVCVPIHRVHKVNYY
ncbi:hypothetical protein FLAV_00932 [Flavobacteriales bacterium]|nr:hypothetical protein [Flavobacteriales bacterium]WKZ74592.1 MAG: hypothetical protein QY303_10610 [Vicingaceae bacterium]GIK68893.1 MAG: hypothetical protein BroJett020_01880 [Bacteroidota bacterium]CAG0965385.1 hypothetical protein FLAV_00932 [Flavobacteriales bacterium]